MAKQIAKPSFECWSKNTMELRQEDELAQQIKQWVMRFPRWPQTQALPFTDETDLIASGVLDSMGFVELMLYLETIIGEQVDLNEADPRDFTTIKGLCHTVMVQRAPSKTGRV
jgi:acyl carrier protein